MYIYYIYMIIFIYTHSNKQAQGSLTFLDIAIHCHMLDLAEVSHQFKALCLSSGGCCLLGVSWLKLGGWLINQVGFKQLTHTHTQTQCCWWFRNPANRLISSLPSLKLTYHCHLKMMVSNRNLHFQGFIFRCYVSFREVIPYLQGFFLSIPGGALPLKQYHHHFIAGCVDS